MQIIMKMIEIARVTSLSCQPGNRSLRTVSSNQDSVKIRYTVEPSIAALQAGLLIFFELVGFYVQVTATPETAFKRQHLVILLLARSCHRATLAA